MVQKFKLIFWGVFRLQLSTRNFLELQDVAFIPSIKRNLKLVPILDNFGYIFLFGTEKVKLHRDELLIGIGVRCGNLYILELSALPYVSTTLLLILLVA